MQYSPALKRYGTDTSIGYGGSYEKVQMYDLGAADYFTVDPVGM
jgi:hypothetical protein